jgi:hypothetical protein
MNTVIALIKNTTKKIVSIIEAADDPNNPYPLNKATNNRTTAPANKDHPKIFNAFIHSHSFVKLEFVKLKLLLPQTGLPFLYEYRAHNQIA